MLLITRNNNNNNTIFNTYMVELMQSEEPAEPLIEDMREGAVFSFFYAFFLVLLIRLFSRSLIKCTRQSKSQSININ